MSAETPPGPAPRQRLRLLTILGAIFVIVILVAATIIGFKIYEGNRAVAKDRGPTRTLLHATGSDPVNTWVDHSHGTAGR